MKRSIIFFMLIIFLAVFSDSSTMYSIEYGKIYTESYNYTHYLSSLYPNDCKPSHQYDNSLSTGGNGNHFHVIPLNPQAFDNGRGVNHYFNILPIDSPFLISSNPHVSTIVLSPDFFNKLKILTDSHLSLHKSTVLLI